MFNYTKVEIESPMFEGLRIDFNDSLKKLLKKMITKDIECADLTLKLSIDLRDIEDFSDEEAKSPVIAYKVTSTTKESESKSGLYMNDSVLVFRDDEFRIRKAESNQLSLDGDFDYGGDRY